MTKQNKHKLLCFIVFTSKPSCLLVYLCSFVATLALRLDKGMNIHMKSSHKQVESLVSNLRVWTWGVQRKSHNVNKNIDSFESKGECGTTLVKREVGNLDMTWRIFFQRLQNKVIKCPNWICLNTLSFPQWVAKYNINEWRVFFHIWKLMIMMWIHVYLVPKFTFDRTAHIFMFGLFIFDPTNSWMWNVS